ALRSRRPPLVRAPGLENLAERQRHPGTMEVWLRPALAAGQPGLCSGEFLCASMKVRPGRGLSPNYPEYRISAVVEVQLTWTPWELGRWFPSPVSPGCSRATLERCAPGLSKFRAVFAGSTWR